MYKALKDNMKKNFYIWLAGLNHRIKRQLDYHEPSAAKAEKIKATLMGTRQLQALMLERFSEMDIDTFRDWPKYSWLGKDGVDGWLLYLLANAGMGNKCCVEIGAATATDGNTINLIINHGFTGYMIDANGGALMYGKNICDELGVAPPVFIESFITKENIAPLCGQYQLPPDPEVLCLDIDSIDWYVLQALPLKPAILVVEFNNLWGPEEAMTVPYDPTFQRKLTEYLYGGASLLAFNQLLIPKGYKLVAVADSGYDAIFVQDNQRFSFAPAISVTQGYKASLIWQQRHLAGLHHSLRKNEWVKV
jgi:hypothetical protein